MTPPLMPDVDVMKVLAAGALNPLAIATSYLMGRKADQLAKILIAGFAGGLVACATLYVAAKLGFTGAVDLSRAIAGVLSVGMIEGIVVAWMGYKTRR